MTVSKEQAMQMFDHDLSMVMDEIGGMLAHYRIADWESYLFFRKPGCPESYVLKYEASAGDDLAKAIVALHATLTKDSAVVSPDLIWDALNKKRHELIDAKQSRFLTTQEVAQLSALQLVADMTRDLLSGGEFVVASNIVAPSPHTEAQAREAAGELAMDILDALNFDTSLPQVRNEDVPRIAAIIRRTRHLCAEEGVEGELEG